MTRIKVCFTTCYDLLYGAEDSSMANNISCNDLCSDTNSSVFTTCYDMLCGETEPNVFHYMLCNVTNPSVVHHIPCFVTCGQRKLDQCTSVMMATKQGNTR